MAVASAGPYASLHLALDRHHASTPPLSFFTGRMPFLPPNQQRQSTEGCKHSLQFTVNKIVYEIVSAMSEDLYIEVSTHFGIESVENLIANHRNRFINRYSETDNYLCQMLRRVAGCCTWFSCCAASVGLSTQHMCLVLSRPRLLAFLWPTAGEWSHRGVCCHPTSGWLAL